MFNMQHLLSRKCTDMRLSRLCRVNAEFKVNFERVKITNQHARQLQDAASIFFMYTWVWAISMMYSNKVLNSTRKSSARICSQRVYFKWTRNQLTSHGGCIFQVGVLNSTQSKGGTCEKKRITSDAQCKRDKNKLKELLGRGPRI